MTQKYNTRQKYGTGWFNESNRHSLARQGIKTGRKDYSKPITVSGVSYQPTTVETEVPKELTEQEIMPDVDEIVVESNEERVIPEWSEELSLTPEEDRQEDTEDVKEETLSKEIERDLSELEVSENPVNVLQRPWGERVGERIKEFTQNALQSYKDTNVSGIEKHISSLEEEKVNISDRVNILTGLKNRVMSKEYRDVVGISKQLSQVKRVNSLLSEPLKHMNTINSTVSMLNRRKEILTRPSKTGEKKSGVVKEIYSSVFPTFGEMMHPERLTKK